MPVLQQRFEINERLQIFDRHTLLGQLPDDGAQALGAKRELVLAFGAMRMRSSKRLERRADAIDRWRKRLHDTLELGWAVQFAKGAARHLAAIW